MSGEQNRQILGFEHDYKEYYFPSIKYTLKKTQNLQDAEDIVCNAFMYCYEHFSDYDPEKACFSTWLYLVINSRIKNYYRDKKDHVELEKISDMIHDSADSIENAFELAQMRAQIAKALSGLSETHRRVVIMKYFKKYSSKQISAETGLSEGNVRVILSRAMTQMRKTIDGG